MGSAQTITGCKKWTLASKCKNARPNSAAAALPGTAGMDYTLAALKVFGSQLADSTEAPSSEGTSAAQVLFGVRYQRVWMQGVILSAEYQEGGEARLVLDDGSCVTDLRVAAKEAESQFWRAGMYVLVIGAYVAPETEGNYPAVKVHKIVDLSSQPDREAMWYMEVAEAYNLFYLPSLFAARSSS